MQIILRVFFVLTLLQHHDLLSYYFILTLRTTLGFGLEAVACVKAGSRHFQYLPAVYGVV